MALKGSDQSLVYKTLSHGRGGAGNIVTEPFSPINASDLKTPIIKSNMYSTGRGGSGNMARNDCSNPKIARAAQDISPVCSSTWCDYYGCLVADKENDSVQGEQDVNVCNHHHVSKLSNARSVAPPPPAFLAGAPPSLAPSLPSSLPSSQPPFQPISQMTSQSTSQMTSQSTSQMTSQLTSQPTSQSPSSSSPPPIPPPPPPASLLTPTSSSPSSPLGPWPSQTTSLPSSSPKSNSRSPSLSSTQERSPPLIDINTGARVDNTEKCAIDYGLSKVPKTDQVHNPVLAHSMAVHIGRGGAANVVSAQFFTNP